MRSFEMALARAADIDAITALLQANTSSNGGSLFGEFPRSKVEKMVLRGAGGSCAPRSCRGGRVV